MTLESAQVLDKARICLGLERQALEATEAALDETFVRLVERSLAVLRNGHKLIFTGVGKNAFIGQKLAGTFNSTGATACFLDPLQALHGDLGLGTAGDLAFLFSNSGETVELLQLLPALKRMGIATAAVTGDPDSALARSCEYRLLYRIVREACPLDLTPTASTTAALALGDALAMVCLELREVSRDDFARFHPAGTLGKSLLLHVSDIMRQGERFACVPDDTPVREALFAITRARCGCVALTDPVTGRLTGVFTDGDLRRCLVGENGGASILDHPVADYMTRDPKSVRADALAVEAVEIFEGHAISDLIAVDAHSAPVGLLDSQDLPRLKIV